MRKRIHEGATAISRCWSTRPPPQLRVSNVRKDMLRYIYINNGKSEHLGLFDLLGIIGILKLSNWRAADRFCHISVDFS